MLVTAIREKRRDLIISPQGSYAVNATVLSDDITKRSDSYETHLYRWTKRNVKVNYQVTETQSGDQVWSGIIDTYSENFASFEFDIEIVPLYSGLVSTFGLGILLGNS